MSNTQMVSFNMYEMEYKGGEIESILPFIPLEDKHYEQYKSLIDSCFYEMRKNLNIKPYEKHRVSLKGLEELKGNTFLLLDNDEIICAVTCYENNIEGVAVSLKHQRRGYGRKLMEFAISHIQKRGLAPVKLTVAKWNENAIALYKSLGFEITRESVVTGVNTKDGKDNWSFEFTAKKGLNIR